MSAAGDGIPHIGDGGGYDDGLLQGRTDAERFLQELPSLEQDTVCGSWIVDELENITGVVTGDDRRRGRWQGFCARLEQQLRAAAAVCDEADTPPESAVLAALLGDPKRLAACLCTLDDQQIDLVYAAIRAEVAGRLDAIRRDGPRLFDGT